MATSRDRILEALQDLPPDATFDDAIERLVFLAKIDAGLAELDEGKGIPHEQVKQRLRAWNGKTKYLIYCQQCLKLQQMLWISCIGKWDFAGTMLFLD